MTVTRAIVTGLLIGGLIWLVDLDHLALSLRQADKAWLAIACLLMPVNIGLEVAKWRSMLSSTSPTSTIDAVGSVLLGYTLGLLTPIRLGEYVGRSMYLGGNHVRNAILTACDRMLSMLVCVGLGLIATGVSLAVGLIQPSTWILVGGLLGIVSVGALTVVPFLGKLDSSRYSRWIELVRLDNLPWLVLLSAARHAVFTVQLVVLVIAFGGSASWLALLAAATLVFFVKTLIPQFTFADLGIRESAAIFFFGLIGVSAASALNASLALFALNLVLPAVAGLPFASRVRLSISSLAVAPSRPKWSTRSS